jgi:hypothetical protein
VRLVAMPVAGAIGALHLSNTSCGQGLWKEDGAAYESGHFPSRQTPEIGPKQRPRGTAAAETQPVVGRAVDDRRKAAGGAGSSRAGALSARVVGGFHHPASGPSG